MSTTREQTENTHANAPAAAAPAPLGRAVDGQTFTIGVLSVTACVLLVGFLLVTMMPRTASAIGTSDRGGDYVMLTQQLSNSTEGVVIIDAAAKRMNLYVLDLSSKQLKLLQNNVPLDQLPTPQRQERAQP